MAKSVNIYLEETVARLPAGSATIGNGLMQVVPQILAIMRVCKEKGAETMWMDHIVELCLDADLAVKKHIHCRNCGIHPSNRAGKGVDPFHAQKLLLKISRQGYSEMKLENPMGFEKAAPGTAASAQEAFMARNYNLAAGYLKTIPFHDVEYLPVTCSHTFAALNIIEAGSTRLGLHKKLATDGKIDQARALKLSLIHI